MTKTILAIGGHIGDMDLTAGPLLATAALNGDRVILLSCTYGERGHPRMSPQDYKAQKIAEANEFAAGIGAEYRFLDYSDGFLVDSDDAAQQIVDLIRAEKPDVLISHWKNSIHRDHRRASRLAARARFLASLPTDDGRPMVGVHKLLCADNWEDSEGFAPDAFYEIPEPAFERWRDAIQHEAFARGETYGFRYIDYYCANMLAKGCLAGVQRACGFVVAEQQQQVLRGL